MSRTTCRRARPSRMRRRCSPTCSSGTGARPSPAGGGISTSVPSGLPSSIGEPDAIGGLTGGDVVAEAKRSVVRRFFFPPQEHRFAPGDNAHDSVTDKGWTVVAIDDALGMIDLKIGAGYDGPLPASLVPDGPIPTPTQRDRLRDLGARVVRDGVSGRDAATALLLRFRPADGAPWGEPCATRARPRPTRRSGSSWPCVIRTCPSRGRREPGRRSPGHGRSSN